MNYESDSDLSDLENFSEDSSSDLSDEMFGGYRNPKGEMTNKEIKEYLKSQNFKNYSKMDRKKLKDYLQKEGLSVMKDQRLPPKSKTKIKKIVKAKVKKSEDLFLDSFEDKYKIVKSEGLIGFKLLGRGAHGIVKLAENKKTGEEVAAKYIQKVIKNKSTKEIFEQEVQILEKIKKIPNVSHILDYYTSDPKYYIIVLDIGPSQSVQDIRDDKELSQEQRIAYAYLILDDMARILNALQNANIINRDVKPNNMLFDRKTKRFMMIDFGSAIENTSKNDKELYDKVGTEKYMAPEIILDKGATFRSDIFSLGVSIYDLVNKLPYRYKENGIWMKRGPSNSGDPLLDKIINQMTSRTESKRPLAKNVIEWLKIISKK